MLPESIEGGSLSRAKRKSHWLILQRNVTINKLHVFVCWKIQYIPIPMHIQTFLEFVTVRREEVLISLKLISKYIGKMNRKKSISVTVINWILLKYRYIRSSEGKDK